MKRLIFGGLSALLLAATSTPPVTANTVAINSVTLNTTYSNHLQPFNLFNLADRGYLKDQGIPSYGGLKFAYLEGRVTAKDIVAAAVKANLVPAKYLSDESYIWDLEAQLREIETNY